MNVLSLFDGMSCGRIALERAGVKVDNYYSSEIDKYAIQIANKNYPDTKHIGSVIDVEADNLPKIGLLIGGSPCQGFSFAGKQLNFEDERSKLFFEFARLLKECKPKYFLLENVKMKKEYQDVITSYLGVEPIEINSSLVSAQNRKRLYWTNIPNIKQPIDKNISLKDIVDIYNDENINVSSNKRLSSAYAKFKDYLKDIVWIDSYNQAIKIDKATTLTTRTSASCSTHVYINGIIRKPSPIECERLQTVPDNYTAISETKEFYLYNNLETNKKELLCNANIQDAKEEQQHTSMENFVLSITKDFLDMEQQTIFLRQAIKKTNVVIAIEKLEKKVVEQEGCVIDITKIGLDMEMLYIQIKSELLMAQGDIKKELIVKMSTEKYMKILLEDHSIEMKLFIILILLKLIIELKIYIYVMDKASIHFCIDNLKELQGNLLSVELSHLKMESIKLMSNSQRYKMLGNGWTVDVIAHIFKGLI